MNRVLAALVRAGLGLGLGLIVAPAVAVAADGAAGDASLAAGVTVVADGDTHAADYLFTVAGTHRNVQTGRPIATVFDLELGRGSSGGLFYDANVGIGLGAWLGDAAAVGLTMGFGVSGLKDRVPFSIQVPVELFLLANTGERAHAILFVRGTKLFHEGREVDSTMAGPADALTAGLGWVLAAPGKKLGVFLGIEAGPVFGTEAFSLFIGLGRHSVPQPAAPAPPAASR